MHLCVMDTYVHVHVHVSTIGTLIIHLSNSASRKLYKTVHIISNTCSVSQAQAVVSFAAYTTCTPDLVSMDSFWDYLWLPMEH